MKKFFLMLMVVVLLLVGWDIYTHYDYIDAFSGATPKALAQKVPGGIKVKVKTLTTKVYEFNSSSFRLFAKTRVRTRENDANGGIIGSYAYTGVLLGALLEGVDPDKEKGAPFDRPTDIVVKVKAADGKVSYFSYGELTMATDAEPAILAYHREDVLPEKNPDKYTGNEKKPDIEGVCLVCPGDRTAGRYLDSVVEIELLTLKTDDSELPKEQKGLKFISQQVRFIDGANEVIVEAKDLMKKEKSFSWFRIGHGRGIKNRKLVRVSGVGFGNILKAVFKDIKSEDFFLVIGGDGYRVVFSGFELLERRAGERIVLVDKISSKAPHSGVLLGVVSDFYIDRSVRGISHILRLQL